MNEKSFFEYFNIFKNNPEKKLGFLIFCYKFNLTSLLLIPMKDLRKISIKEINERLKHLQHRVTTFEEIVVNIKNPDAKIPLLIQINNYKTAIGFLEAEHNKRSRSPVVS